MTIQFNPVFRFSADAILLIARNYKIAGVNGAARRILGKPGRKLIGRPYREILRWNADEKAPSLRNTQTMYAHAAGLPRTLAVRASQVYDEAGKMEAILVAIKNVHVMRRP